MLKPEWRQFMISLIHASHEVPPASFKAEAMQLLRGLLDFDMGLWISGHAARRQVHNMYLYELPEHVFESWQNIKDEDRILPYIVANPGKTVDVVELYSPGERMELELYRKHSKLYGIEAVICTGLPDPDWDLLEIMSLYRRKAEPGFSKADRQTKQDLFPIMVEAWRNNQIRHLKHAAVGGRQGAAAIIDPKGWVRQAESWFVDLLRLEYPGWKPPRLPEKLLAWCQSQSASEYNGSIVNFSARTQRELTIVLAQPRGPLSSLSTREEEVARMYAAGLTYKEIAAALHLAPATVRSHLESIYRKLEVSSKVDLAQLID